MATAGRHLRTERIMSTHRIAVLAGDGIGKEVVPADIDAWIGSRSSMPWT
jgi:hypothetical protein